MPFNNSRELQNTLDITFSGKTDEHGKMKIDQEITFENKERIFYVIVKFPTNHEFNNQFINIYAENADFSGDEFKDETEVTICNMHSWPLEGTKEFTLCGEDFQPDSDITLFTTFHFIRNDIQKLTNEVLREAKMDFPPIPNAFCCGLSDDTFNYFSFDWYRYHKPKPMDYTLQQQSQTTARISLYEPPRFKINADKESIEVIVPLQIDFFILTRRNQPYATVNVNFLLDVSPVEITSTMDVFALKINKVKISFFTKEDYIYVIHDMEMLLEQFGTESEFKTQVEEIIEQIKDVRTDEKEILEEDGSLNEVLPSIVAEIQPIRTWPSPEGCKTEFQRFYYKKGYIEKQETGYLFAVFSIYSLKLCPPCICPDDLELKLQEEKNRMQNKEQEGYLQSSPKCLDPSMTIAVSEDSLKEIFFPILNQSYNQFAEAETGLVYGKLIYRFRSVLENINITEKGINVNMHLLESGAKIEGRLQVKKIGKTPKKTLSIRVQLENTSVNFNIVQILDQDYQLDLLVQPTVSIGKLDPDLSSTEIPYPISKVIDQLLNLLGESIQPDLNSYLMKKYAFIIFNEVESYRTFFLIDIGFNKSESIVMTFLFGGDPDYYRMKEKGNV
ncbi:hypothetical protein [Alteribacillus bidgolensis]|uniref:Uncharacterized protein n=1 Tax=Alteribacillus bidgolensis TaxID=930129 RepID=A0A1G8S025_9BACI|nr:hypothetical protein [Alteribacillus bidgolensis]SDJ22624.1 hypothetical protein SAMN05216352_1383 [Alteribacillus bidgolensis]